MKEFKLPGAFTKNIETAIPGVYVTEDIYITEVMYNDPATIVFWSDGTKTVSKCTKGDVYSKETGLLICIFKKLRGNRCAKELFDSWVTKDSRVTLKDVRTALKASLSATKT